MCLPTLARAARCSTRAARASNLFLPTMNSRRETGNSRRDNRKPSLPRVARSYTSLWRAGLCQNQAIPAMRHSRSDHVHSLREPSNGRPSRREEIHLARANRSLPPTSKNCIDTRAATLAARGASCPFSTCLIPAFTPRTSAIQKPRPSPFHTCLS